MYNPTREQTRRFFIEAWRKQRERSILSELEAIAVEHILDHPEYHGLLEQGEDNVDRDWLPEMGETNPFLHLSLHLAISEQLSIDQPPGIRAAYEKMLTRGIEPHTAQHTIMDCLAEVIWQAQRQQGGLDNALYLRCLEERIV